MNSRRCEWLNENRPRNDQCSSYRNYKASKNNFRNTHRVTVQAYISSLEQFGSGLLYAVTSQRLSWLYINYI